MPSLELFLLGSPHIKRDGKPITVGLRKSVALLAYLAMTGETHTRDALATLLWPESDQATARMSLRKTLSRLKKSLGEEWLEVDRESLALNCGDGFWLDVARFEALLLECQAHDHAPEDVCPVCFGPLAEAVALYRDDFMAGFTLRDSSPFDEWQVRHSEVLCQRLSGALERLAYGYGAQKKFEPAIAYAKRWLALDPLREEPHRCLMWLYTQAGQRASALRQYEACAQVLEREMGMPPHEDTLQLYRDIKENHLLSPLAFISISPHVCPNNLPLLPTPFVGREDELAKINRLLDDPSRRLVTVTGAGGVGKTRLALQVARQAASERGGTFSHGVYLVPLASLDSAEYLVPAIANALEFSFYRPTNPKAQLFDYLRNKNSLLLLDNFEHLLDGTTLLVEMLSTIPGLRMLVTSRERLNLQWESFLEIRGLAFPANGESGAPEAYPAVQLFLQGAGRVDPEFRLSEDTQREVASLCRYLEGVPLAIELAAVWVETLSCREIVQQIERNLDHLASSMHDVPERHRSLRAAFAHSWDLLSVEERDLFAMLSVFRGSFSKEAAESVAGASQLYLSALAHKSLLQRDARGSYKMLEVLRQYAEEKLRNTPAWVETHDRHCEYYADFVGQREQDFRGEKLSEVLKEITGAIEDVRTGWKWAIARHQWQAIACAAQNLQQYYDALGWFEEGERVFGQAADEMRKAVDEEGESQAMNVSPGDTRAIFGGVLARWGWFHRQLSHYERAHEILQESLSILRLLGVHHDTKYALAVMGIIAVRLGDRSAARQLNQESLAMCEELGDRWSAANRINNLGVVAWMEGDMTLARKYCRQALAIWEEFGDRRSTAIALNTLGGVAMHLGEYAEAEQICQQALSICRETGDRWGMASYYSNLGLVAEAQGEYDEAKHYLLQGLNLCQEVGDRYLEANCLNNLGFVLCALKDYEAANTRFCTTLGIAVGARTPSVALEALVGIGVILGQQEERKQNAVEFAALALNHPKTHPDAKERAQRLLSELESQLPGQVFAAAQERGKAGKLEDYLDICETRPQDA